MQKIRSCVAVVSVFVLLALSGSTLAATRDGGVRDTQSQVLKQKANPKGWIAKVLDYLENKFSIPPG